MLFPRLQDKICSSILIATLASVVPAIVQPSRVSAQETPTTVPIVYGLDHDIDQPQPSDQQGPPDGGAIQFVTYLPPESIQRPASKDSGDDTNHSLVTVGSSAAMQSPTANWVGSSLSDETFIDPMVGGPLASPTQMASPTQSEEVLNPGDYLLQELQLPTEAYSWSSPFERRDYYRSEESIFSWLPASGDNLGWISLESTPYLAYHKNRGSNDPNQGMTTAINIHWLNGPTDIDLPARVYDFVLGYQKQESLSPRFSYDVAGSIGVYSDFEDSARDGIRYVSHAVGMFHATDRLDLVFGVDYLDRNDIAILPVVGFSLRPWRAPNLKIDAIFPRPEIALSMNESDQLYVRGLMGGGSWDIEFPNEANDVMTYRDYQILFGISRRKDNQWNRCEIGYVFDRQLEFVNRSGIRQFDDAFVIRFVTVN